MFPLTGTNVSTGSTNEPVYTKVFPDSVSPYPTVTAQELTALEVRTYTESAVIENPDAVRDPVDQRVQPVENETPPSPVETFTSKLLIAILYGLNSEVF